MCVWYNLASCSIIIIRKFLGIGIAIVYLTYIEMKDLIIFLMSLIIPYRLSIRT